MLKAIPIEEPANGELEESDFEEVQRALPVDEEEVSEGFEGEDEEVFEVE